MGLLHRLFGSTAALAEEMALDEEKILQQWNDYRETLSRKKALMERLRTAAVSLQDLQELQQLSALELTDISQEEKEESELLADLEAVEHARKIKRVQRLEDTVGYAATKYEHVYHLLSHLHAVLRSQMHLIEKLLAGSKKPETLVSHLRMQFELELEVIRQIQQIRTFPDLFQALIKGEHIIRTMDAKEKKLLAGMQAEMAAIFSGETLEGMTYKWAMTVYNKVQDLVLDHEAILASDLDPHHNVDLEFVNRPEFVQLVRDSLREVTPRKVSEQRITVFVHIFREWYNHERD